LELNADSLFQLSGACMFLGPGVVRQGGDFVYCPIDFQNVTPFLAALRDCVNAQVQAECTESATPRRLDMPSRQVKDATSNEESKEVSQVAVLGRPPKVHFEDDPDLLYGLIAGDISARVAALLFATPRARAVIMSRMIEEGKVAEYLHDTHPDPWWYVVG